jgi:hypothetical protein
MMSTPTRNDSPGVTRRDELAISGTVLSEAPWKAAGAAGVVVAGGDLVLHLMLWHLAVSSSVSLGAVAFFAVAGGGALWRARRSRAMSWARRNPWRFAVVPGAACAILVFVLSVLDSGGLFGSAFTAIWHGAAAYGLTGMAGAVARPRRRSA